MTVGSFSGARSSPTETQATTGDRRPPIKPLEVSDKPFPFDNPSNAAIAAAALDGTTGETVGEDPEEEEPNHVNIDFKSVTGISRTKRRAYERRLRKQARPKTKLKNLKETGDTMTVVRNLLSDAIAEGAAETRKIGFVEHTDHNTLSPGIILLNEVFAGLKSYIQKRLKDYNDLSTSRTAAHRTKLLNDLNHFINTLNGVGIPDLKDPPGIQRVKYRSFIAAKLDHPEVDSTRILLHWSNNPDDPADPTVPWIKGATLIVGAWKGGTHSSGHRL